MQSYDAFVKVHLASSNNAQKCFWKKTEFMVRYLTKVPFKQIFTSWKSFVNILDGKVKGVTWQIALCT